MLKIYNYNDNDNEQLIKELKERENEVSGDIVTIVTDILNNVKEKKDEALKEYSLKFDNVDLKELEISKEELKSYYDEVDDEYLQYLKEAKDNIEFYHKAQCKEGYELTKEDGIYLGQKVTPIEKVGIYVPGGTAAYPSTVLMNAVPAKVAGCREIIMTTPPKEGGRINPYIAVAADIAGVDRVFKVGGAQAIAALAYGTQSVPKVDKIFGPGNMFVSVAKKLVFGNVGIDMIAGPSEILVIADDNANPKYVALDLMTQAEHDKYSSSILVTPSMQLATKVNEQLNILVEESLRKDIIIESFKSYGKIIICNDIDQCCEVSNLVAPEHVEVMVENPKQYLDKLINVGSIFLGYNTPETIGDYFGGTNHVLPTNGTARFYSALSVDSFIKKTSYLYYSEEAIQKHGTKIIKFANHEGLEAHANAVEARLK